MTSRTKSTIPVHHPKGDILGNINSCTTFKTACYICYGKTTTKVRCNEQRKRSTIAARRTCDLPLSTSATWVRSISWAIHCLFPRVCKFLPNLCGGQLFILSARCHFYDRLRFHVALALDSWFRPPTFFSNVTFDWGPAPKTSTRFNSTHLVRVQQVEGTITTIYKKLGKIPMKSGNGTFWLVEMVIVKKWHQKTLKSGETPSLFLNHKQFQQPFSEILHFMDQHMGWKKSLLLLLHIQAQLRGCGTHRIGTTDLAQNELQYRHWYCKNESRGINFTMMVLQKPYQGPGSGVELGVSGQICETYIILILCNTYRYINIRRNIRTCSDMVSLKLRCKTKWNPNVYIYIYIQWKNERSNEDEMARG